ncbi:MFS transporter small subunit [Hymenobacter weizhouensis]|nr:hypothetical protein [Hymenobacter sp. YIM 151500-1]UYZ62441.1 hypothetical protein OIS53_15745 [Hymenobacter sp. YIM 151500-1]
MQPTSSSTPTAQEPTSGLSLALAWLYVGVPLAWGVSQTIIKALALFK